MPQMNRLQKPLIGEAINNYTIRKQYCIEICYNNNGKQKLSGSLQESIIASHLERILMNKPSKATHTFEKNNGKKQIGMRNIKTAISTTLCVILYACIDRNPTFACIGAVFGMDNSLPNSLKTGGNRLIGTIIGGFSGMAFFSLSHVLPHPEISIIVLIFIGIIFLIYLSQLLNCSGAIQAGAVVFFIVMLNTPEDEYFSYAINRMIDTGFGVIMSIAINWMHFKVPKRNVKASSKFSN